jgi:hypothetical protein
LAGLYFTIKDRLDPVKIANPGAEIYEYMKLFSADNAANLVVDHVGEYLQKLFFDLPSEIETQAVMCLMRMAEMLSGDVTERILSKLVRTLRLAVSENVDDWRSYDGRPLWFARAS